MILRKTLLLMASAVMCVLLISPAVAVGSTAPGHDYSSLAPGDTPRPEYEYVLDFNQWLDMVPWDQLVPPDFFDMMKTIGVSDLKRDNLIAYDHDGVINIETSYSLDGAEGGLVKHVLKAKPPKSTMLGNIGNDKLVMYMYVSGVQSLIDSIGSIISDPISTDLLFQGNEELAKTVKLGFKSSVAQMNGMFLDLFRDESMVLFFQNPDFKGDPEQKPFNFAWIAPSANGEPVSGDILDTIDSLIGMVNMFGGTDIDSEKIKPQEKEIDGYTCRYWELDPEFSIGMVDADGYFIFCDMDAVEDALDSIGQTGKPSDPPEAANFYAYINYDLYYKSYMKPLGNIFDNPDMLRMMDKMPPGFKDILDMEKSLLVKFTAKADKVDNLGWVDCRTSFTGDGIEMKDRMSQGIADVTLSMKDDADTFIEAVMAKLPEMMKSAQGLAAMD